jgi:hypothetical protein
VTASLHLVGWALATNRFRLGLSLATFVVILLIGLTNAGAKAMAEGKADRQALAQLRPGAALADVASAFGDRWAAPLPHREGHVLTRDATDGVVVRITSDGKLGSIRFNWRFGDAIPVLGLAMSARGKAVKARFPSVDLAPLPFSPFSYSTISEAPGLEVSLELGTTAEGERYLRALTLSDAKAVYPAKQSVVYADPQGEPGAPFKDVNFKLAVLSELISKGDLDLSDPQDLYDHVLGRRFDLEAEGYQPVSAARDYLARYPLTPDLLDKVKTLELDGGADIYPYIEYFWDGESEAYTITSFAGVEHLRNLGSIRIISMVDPATDLSPIKSRGINIR